MASPRQRANWPELRAEYISDLRTTYASIAKKYGVTAKAVEWHSAREGRTAERRVHSERVREKLGDLTSSNAAESLAAIHRQHLTATNDLREMIAQRLKASDVSIVDLARVASAYGQLLSADRVALGADLLPGTHPRAPETEMSDDQLYAKLREMLERHPVTSIQ